MSEFEIKICDTTKEPSGKHIGLPYVKENTAEYFRQSVLVPALQQHETLLIDFINSDTQEELSIAASWLEEAFAGLIKYGYLTLEEFKRRVRIKTTTTQRFYNLKVNQYVSQAVYSSAVYTAPIEGHDTVLDQKTSGSLSSALAANSGNFPYGRFQTVPAENNTKRFVFVYENEVKSNQKILCIELEMYFPMSLQFVADGAIQYEPLLTSTKAIRLLDLPEFMEHVKSYNIFSCDRDEIEDHLEELSGCTFLRRLRRDSEITFFDPHVSAAPCK